MSPRKKLAIIGAGLSGLYAASLLQDEFNITILEARNRTGGRILTKEEHDLGPSWVWPYQENILSLITELKLELFPQFNTGNALYESPQGIQIFNPPPSTPSARMKGGLRKLTDELERRLIPNTIHLNEAVIEISQSDSSLHLRTSKNTYKVDYVLCTLAPRLAAENIQYHPPLNKHAKTSMLQTPTWMGHAVKCVIEFKEAFWRDQGLSGFVFSHVGPLGEIHDASTDTQPALFGFLQQKASTQHLIEDVTAQIKRLFGDNSRLITNIYFTDWKEEVYSCTHHDHQRPSQHPQYGLDLTHFDNRLFFMGTETAFDNGGYLEGAVNSAKTVVQKLRTVTL